MTTIKYQFGSIYEPNQNTINIKTFKAKPKPQVWLDFKNKQNFPYIYIMDVVKNEISDPILATPLYKCDVCQNSIVYMDLNNGVAVCNKCNKKIEITPHLFFNTNIYYYRQNAGIQTDQLNKNGLPSNWELKCVKNITAYTYNDSQRIYDSGIVMKECDIDLINKYKKYAKISNNYLKNKKSFKILIYREFATPIYNHHGVGLELCNNKWKVITIKDQEQFMTKITPLIDMPDVFINIEYINDEVKEILKKQYLNEKPDNDQ